MILTLWVVGGLHVNVFIEFVEKIYVAFALRIEVAAVLSKRHQESVCQNLLEDTEFKSKYFVL